MSTPPGRRLKTIGAGACAGSRVTRTSTVIAAIACVFHALSGCGTTVIPPRSPHEPVTVFLLDHGRTPSLVLPIDDQMVRYAYGDWQWYALGKTGAIQGLAALLLPTRGTLGRKVLDGPADIRAIDQQVLVGIDRAYAISVPRADVRSLHAKLDEVFDANLETRVMNERADLEFVHHPRQYCYLHNSNHAVAGWLRDLGCRTRGLSLESAWKVQDSD
jgi:hypothetical protein